MSKPKSPKEIFAAQVRRYRLRRNLSQLELAKRAGVEQTAISKIETAKHDPMMRTIAKMAAALGVEVVALMRE